MSKIKPLPLYLLHSRHYNKPRCRSYAKVYTVKCSILFDFRDFETMDWFYFYFFCIHSICIYSNVYLFSFIGINFIDQNVCSHFIPLVWFELYLLFTVQWLQTNKKLNLFVNKIKFSMDHFILWIYMRINFCMNFHVWFVKLISI